MEESFTMPICARISMSLGEEIEMYRDECERKTGIRPSFSAVVRLALIRFFDDNDDDRYITA